MTIQKVDKFKLQFFKPSILQFTDKKNLEIFVNKHYTNIIKFIHGSKINTAVYKNSPIPFIYIQKSLENIHHPKIKKLQNRLAKVYIKKETDSLKELTKSIYKDTLIFRYHKKFLKLLIKSVKKDKLKHFPLISADECEFKKILYYPKAKMLFKKHHREKLLQLHRTLHESINSFYYEYANKNYTDAYTVFQTVKENLFHFVKILNEFYSKTFLNIEESFFQAAYEIQKNEDIFLTIIDIKNLKNFNQIYGERVVNRSIKVLAQRLNTFMKKNYSSTLTIKAESADFFMLNTKMDSKRYNELVKEIYNKLSKPINIKNTQIQLPIIIAGIKIKTKDKIDKNSLTHSLIMLKEKAKKLNKKNYLVTYNDLNLLLQNSKENFIINKLNSKQIDIVFQPIFRTKNKELYSLEVLGRIVDEGKLIPAGAFIDTLYEINMIEKFDSLILEKLIQKEHLIKSLTDKIFLNISFQSLLNPSYMKKLKNFLEVFGVEVILELTEQKFVSDLDLIKNIYDRYKIKFAVDDFGTGYSSLHIVVELIELGILKILKIDGSLIKDVQKNNNLKKIVSLISKLGNDFNLLTVAEFVENAEVLEFLDKTDISLSQGYFLSKPKTIDELIKEKEEFEATKRKNFIYKLVY